MKKYCETKANELEYLEGKNNCGKINAIKLIDKEFYKLEDKPEINLEIEPEKNKNFKLKKKQKQECNNSNINKNVDQIDFTIGDDFYVCFTIKKSIICNTI